VKFVKAHYASIGLIVLGIGQLLTGDTNTGCHSILLGLAAFGIHGAVLANGNAIIDAAIPRPAPPPACPQRGPPCPMGAIRCQ
jgi:hypothetical protein